MPKIRLTNENDQTLRVWLEPWCEEYWMRPGDVFTIGFGDTDYSEHVIGDADFDVQFDGEGVTVWTGSHRWVPVRDQSGTELEPGHQIPIEVLRTRTETAEAVAQNPFQGRQHMTPEIAETVRASAELLREKLTGAETTALQADRPM